MAAIPNCDVVDVLVVGAGPVGLVAAHELARGGVRVRIIDKLAQPTAESRAIALHARSLEMLDRMGVIEDLLATGVKSTGMKMVANGKILVRVPLDAVDSAFPYTFVTAQTETERVLTAHVAALGVSIDRGLAVTAFTQDDDAVYLTVQRPDGTTEQIAARWVIGTDGGHSTMRRLVGSKLAGLFQGERFILGDVEAEHHLGNTNMCTFLSPDGPVVTLPMRGGRVRFLAQIHDAPGTPLNQHPTQEQLQQIVDERIGDITITQSHWLTCFEIHHGQVPDYRYGRVFLAGDAAHIHSPAGGQGMNTGIQDAFNLSWKLAAVIRGEGGQTLLDSYNAERHQVGKKVIDFTSLLTRVGTLRGGARLVRDVIIHAVGGIAPAARKMADAAAEVNVAYRDSPIAVGHRVRHAEVVAGDHLPHLTDAEVQKQISSVCGQDTDHTVLTVAAGHVAPAAGGPGQRQVLITADDTPVAGYDAVVADPNGVVAQRLGLKRGGRVVVRPDGYLGAVASLDDTTTVADYFAKIGS
jgi:2-polyprenyl-6-methoxyphenol hydroxylase-like FAD-dependent oxidoreductase